MAYYWTVPNVQFTSIFIILFLITTESIQSAGLARLTLFRDRRTLHGRARRRFAAGTVRTWDETTELKRLSVNNGRASNTAAYVVESSWAVVARRTAFAPPEKWRLPVVFSWFFRPEKGTIVGPGEKRKRIDSTRTWKLRIVYIYT